MTDPRIRYARTSDGVNIAYWAMGDGVPIVSIDLPTSNIQYDLEAPITRAAYEATARVVTVVRYDHRGFGLSDRFDGEFTTAAFVLDLEAVVDALHLARFFLIASRGPTYPIALAYAKLHPERIIRIAAVVSGPPSEFTRALLDNPGADWDFMTEAVSRRIAGWNDERAAAELAEHIRQSTDLAGMRRFLQWFDEERDPAELSDVAMPCLFLPMNYGGLPWLDQARSLASRIPDASVKPIAGATDSERAVQMREAIGAFFGESRGAPPPVEASPERAPGSSAIILFLDIADSTALTERMGDAAFRAASSALDARLRTAIREVGGTPVEGKVMGDGVMATFASAREAIDAALRCNALSEESELRLHIGLHAGDVIREPGHLYGGAVNIAARICDASAPGEVLVSDVVRGMARTSAGVKFEDRGEREMKGVGEPVRVYAVRMGVD
jgi:class 3 adenylate cyclase